MARQPAPLFPTAPEDLSGLTVEELNALASEFQTIARAIAANDEDVIGGTSAESVIEQMTAGVVELERVRSELAAREEAEAAFVGTVEELAAQMGVEEEAAVEETEPLAAVEDDEDDEDEETEDGPEAEASVEETVEEVAAEPVAAAVVPRRFSRPAPAPRSHQPRVTSESGPTPAPLVAAGGVEAVARPGQALDRPTMLRLLGESQRLINSGSGARKMVVASAQFDYPESRQLGDNADLNWERIRAITSEQAITASGGFCAPYPPLYDLPMISSAIRPVRDALPGFQATRGGITFPTPLGLSDVIDGISVITAQQDEDGGSMGTKSCVVIDCDPFQSAEVQAIAACVQHGNLNARAWPERVGTVADLLAAAHAQAAEGELLAALTAGSTAVTDAAVYGAYSSLVQGILKAAAAYRSRHRMTPDVRLRAMFPAWVRELIAADLAHVEDDRLSPDAAIAAVEGYLSRAGVNISWYIDQDGTTTQVYGAQGAGALLDFISEVSWYLFHEGAWIFLDFGRLDLGMTRDSDLNSTNDFNVMWETFEGAAMVGVESLNIVSQVCPSGETAAPYDNLITCGS